MNSPELEPGDISVPRWVQVPVGLLMTAFTLLCLIGSATLIFQPNAKAPVLAPAIGVVTAIGVLGYLVVRSLENAANVHIRRARKARSFLPQVEALAKGSPAFMPLARYFLGLNALVVVFGVALSAAVLIPVYSSALPKLLECRWPA